MERSPHSAVDEVRAAMAAPGAAGTGSLSLWHAALRIFDLTLGQMLWSRRTVFMALVVGAPVVLAVCLRLLLARDMLTIEGSMRGRSIVLSGPAIFGVMIWAFYLRFTVPVLGVFYGTALIADEVEDKTLTYLFTRPIARRAVLLGKYLAYLACTGLVVLPSVVLVYFLVLPILGGNLGASFPALLTDVLILALGLAVYGALFALVGAAVRRPLLTGLLFIFGWEPVAVFVPGYLRRFTVAYYLQSLVPHAMPQDSTMGLLQTILRVFQEPPPAWVCLAWLLGIWLSGLALASVLVDRREYVLEQ
jgi:ABC-type transport system involved in multi-copper enzyme maturation permease subunit